MSNEQEWNPLEGWTKEQIKSVLKANTKTTLLKTAMQWRVIAEQLQTQLDELQNDDTTETTPSETDS